MILLTELLIGLTLRAVTGALLTLLLMIATGLRDNGVLD